jgi:hypothetical protein
MSRNSINNVSSKERPLQQDVRNCLVNIFSEDLPSENVLNLQMLMMVNSFKEYTSQLTRLIEAEVKLVSDTTRLVHEVQQLPLKNQGKPWCPNQLRQLLMEACKKISINHGSMEIADMIKKSNARSKQDSNFQGTKSTQDVFEPRRSSKSMLQSQSSTSISAPSPGVSQAELERYKNQINSLEEESRKQKAQLDKTNEELEKLHSDSQARELQFRRAKLQLLIAQRTLSGLRAANKDKDISDALQQYFGLKDIGLTQ